jgi:hydrogenase expression/formation protein HypE
MLSCPMLQNDGKTVLLAHGGGGTLTHQLIEKLFLPAFSNDALDGRHDSSVVTIGSVRVSFTTDSYVVRPLFFPGGDIGSLAVHGTVNDLAMSGARPLFISLALVIEEGFSMDSLRQIVDSAADAARRCGVQIVTGDTKVVDRGKGDGVYINTSGLGIVEHGMRILPDAVESGDAVILSGDLARHGIAIMSAREGMEFETIIESDSAPLNHVVQAVLDAGAEIHCMRDLTRGGLASALNEIAEAAGVDIEITERAIPVREDVRAACEILGFDPLYVANEGRFVLFTPRGCVGPVMESLKENGCPDACIIGFVEKSDAPLVTLQSAIGGVRVVQMLSGEQLPRIC